MPSPPPRCSGCCRRRIARQPAAGLRPAPRREPGSRPRSSFSARCQIASYPASRMAAAGNFSCGAFSSCRQTTSGPASASHSQQDRQPPVDAVHVVGRDLHLVVRLPPSTQPRPARAPPQGHAIRLASGRGRWRTGSARSAGRRAGGSSLASRQTYTVSIRSRDGPRPRVTPDHGRSPRHLGARLWSRGAPRTMLRNAGTRRGAPRGARPREGGCGLGRGSRRSHTGSSLTRHSSAHSELKCYACSASRREERPCGGRYAAARTGARDPGCRPAPVCAPAER